jgi:serine/threonine protein kinase
MPEIGQTLSHFKIVGKIGQGGMGEVYLADDTTLDRKVALKFLPEAFTSDPERMARFEREAKLLASLNHPNIAGIYGLEQADGNRFLVLEYVEGETLQARLSKGALPLEDALELCRQIAEGLEAAHEKGVIHRDLKPANVMITAEEKVKILDFGLAKAFSDDAQNIDSSQSPTLTEAMTQPGVILGTAAYMSPEQAKGKSVDKRADIWAFGAVLFEMLTGKPAFPGEDISEILASVIKGDSNLSLLPKNIHTRVREVLARCLQKDLRKRYADIADARYEIEHVLADPSRAIVQPAAAVEPRMKLWRNIPWIAAAVILTAIIAGLAGWYLKPLSPPEPKPVVCFDFTLPESQQFGDLTERAFAISPDGSQLVYSTEKGLYLRSMKNMDSKLLPGTEGSTRPFFSPNGKWVGFFSSTDSRLKKIAIGSGPPVPLAEVGIFGSFDWGADGNIRYGGLGSGIMAVSADGGTPEQVIKPAGDETIGHPQILPDGDSVLLTRASPQPAMIMVYSLKSGKRNELFEGTVAKYLPSGNIVYELGGSLFAVRFDLNTLQVIGGHIPLIDGILRVGGPQYAISRSGTLAYIPGASAGSAQRTLVWVDRTGNEKPLTAEPKDYRWLKISPDGTQVALSINTAGSKEDIWVYDLVRGNWMRVTFDEKSAGESVWTLDGERIIFCYYRENIGGIYLKSANGTGTAEQIISLDYGDIWPEFLLSDGKTLLVGREIGRETGNDIGMLSLEGDRTLKLLLNEKYDEGDPRISTNEQWLAYGSNETGEREVYVRSFPDIDKVKRPVSTGGGDSPLWSPDGSELFYRNGDSFMAVEIETEPSFSLGKPTLLFEGTYSSHPNVPECVLWDIHPDGKRFLMLKPTGLTDETTEAGSPRKINIVINWLEELKEKAPVD